MSSKSKGNPSLTERKNSAFLINLIFTNVAKHNSLTLFYMRGKNNDNDLFKNNQHDP